MQLLNRRLTPQHCLPLFFHTRPQLQIQRLLQINYHSFQIAWLLPLKVLSEPLLHGLSLLSLPKRYEIKEKLFKGIYL